MADSHAGIQGYTRMYLTTDMGAHTHAHINARTLISKESVRCDCKRWGAMERKILYRWKVKNKTE